MFAGISEIKPPIISSSHTSPKEEPFRTNRVSLQADTNLIDAESQTFFRLREK